MLNHDPPKTGPFRRAARRAELWQSRASMGQDPRQVLREDDSDSDYDIVHENPHAKSHGHDAFKDLVEQFDFALEEGDSGQPRDPGMAKLRDVIHLGDVDETVQELCTLLGWEKDLERVQKEGKERFDEFKASSGDRGWWSVFEYPNLVEDNEEAKVQEKKRLGGMVGGANDAWQKLQTRFGIERPTNCEFM